MTPYYADDLVTLHHGDCLDVMRTLPDNSVEAVVTDPPYGLGFMSREWDSFDDQQLWLGYADSINTAFGRWCKMWTQECLRILKPGGHLLAFGGTRTWHRLACAVEDAGFEVRDNIAWLYGSGFPKSLDVARAIDKRRDDLDEIRRVCRYLRESIDASPTHTVSTIAEYFGLNRRMVEHWAARDTDSQPTLPTWEQWRELGVLLGLSDELDQEVWRLNGRKGSPGEDYANAEVIGEHVGQTPGFLGERFLTTDRLVRAPGSETSATWAGWGTALKPAFEPVVVGRKPLAGTVAANVLAHGTGALNIDGCRVGLPDGFGGGAKASSGFAGGYEGDGFTASTKGRWPANVVLDDTQAAELDRQSGVLTSGANPTRRGRDKLRDAYGDFAGQEECEPARGADSGGAARFFPTFRYEAKAGADERPRDGDVAHPTVKPLDLMRWLVRLVTPPGGTVLEPFAGSGTTAEACVIEGFRCIAVEREATYLPLIVARLTKPIQPDLFGGAA